MLAWDKFIIWSYALLCKWLQHLQKRLRFTGCSWFTVYSERATEEQSSQLDIFRRCRPCSVSAWPWSRSSPFGTSVSLWTKWCSIWYSWVSRPRTSRFSLLGKKVMLLVDVSKGVLKGIHLGVFDLCQAVPSCAFCASPQFLPKLVPKVDLQRWWWRRLPSLLARLSSQAGLFSGILLASQTSQDRSGMHFAWQQKWVPTQFLRYLQQCLKFQHLIDSMNSVYL